MGRLIYGYWDCPYCESKGIRGDIRECPNCGRPRSENTKFYTGDNIEYVPVEKTKDANRNPDWLCPYCNALNSDKLSECESCGAPRESDRKSYFDLHKNSNNLKQKTEQPAQNETSTKTQKLKPEPEIPMRKQKLCKGILLTSAIAIALVFLTIFMFGTNTKRLTVSGFSWERSITVEKLITADESDWSLPSNARLQYTNKELKEYRNVIDHYETKTKQVQKQRISGYEEYVSGYRDLGNGMFEEIISERPIYETYYETETYEEPVYRQDPIYATKYYYEIDKWVTSRTVKTNGSDKNPVWGETNLADKERTGSKTEKYTVCLRDKESTYNYDVSLSTWNNLKEGMVVDAEISRFGTITNITIIE